MKNTSKVQHSEKPLSALSWAFLFVWGAGAFLFLTTSTIVLQICGLVVAISGAFCAIWFHDEHKSHGWLMGALVLLLCWFFTDGKESQGYSIAYCTFVIGAMAATLLSKISKSS